MSSPSISADEFRRAAAQHANWIANYFEHVRDFPVVPQTEPGDLKRMLPARAPEQGESLEKILADFDTEIFPALTLWNHPRFFAWFSISSSEPAILAEMLAATVNVNAMLWKSSPAATELEEITLGWLRDWLSLPDDLFGIIYDTASVGVFQALAAAREYVDPESRTEGMRPGLIVYVSEQAHSSAEKAAIALGFGQDNIRKIGVDAEFRMRPDLLDDAIRADLSAGKRPCAVVATVGTTSTASIDPISAIADLTHRHGAWLHVDAAYGGSAAIVPEMRHVLDGAERADSIVVNPHKGLFVPIDLSVLYTKRPDVLKRACSLKAEYLKTEEDSSAVNYMDYGIQLGRRFRALKLWYVCRYYGRSGVTAILRESLRLAQVLRTWIMADEQFEVVAPTLFSLVCFRHRAGNVMNQELLVAVNRSGKAFLSHTVLRGTYVLRFAIGNMRTTEDDIRDTWDSIRNQAAELLTASESTRSSAGV
jgi:aromatic-L-amino-acid decarboxylase